MPDPRLFELPDERPDAAVAAGPSPLPSPSPSPDGAFVVRVLPDVAAIDKEFDYLVPDHLRAQVRVGTVVRVELHGRRVGAWVTAVDVGVAAGLVLRPIAKVTGWGPPPDLFSLSGWAAWRWAGRRASFLATATHDHAVPALPPARARAVAPRVAVQHARVVADAFGSSGVAVVQLPPAADAFELAAAAAARPGSALVLAPSVSAARELGVRLRRAGLVCAVLPAEWASARAGATAVGSRAAAWAPVVDLSAIVVIDEHDEVYQEERSPTWHARDVAVERARRAGVPCVLVSPAPTLEALHEADRVYVPPRPAERAGWPVVDVVDLRAEDPMRGGLLSERLAHLVQDGRRIVCVLNRKGRAKQLICGQCQALARCERCEAAVGLDDAGGALRCARCGDERPVVCATCGATRLKALRPGVARLRDDLALLTDAPVVEVTAGPSHAVAPLIPDAQVYVGTETVLHRFRGRVDVVAFVDLDQELTAPRYRAAEQALALVIRGARVVGGRDGGGRLLLQTRVPDHEVVQAAVHADPERVRRVEAVRRAQLRYPPFAALAAVSGASANAFMDAFGRPEAIDVLGPADGMWLLRAADHATLCDALAATVRPPGRVRIEVDPLRI